MEKKYDRTNLAVMSEKPEYGHFPFFITKNKKQSDCHIFLFKFLLAAVVTVWSLITLLVQGYPTNSVRTTRSKWTKHHI